jgi:hypothetical protein
MAKRIRIRRDFFIFDADKGRIDYAKGQTVGITSIPLGHSAEEWIAKGHARGPWWVPVWRTLQALSA